MTAAAADVRPQLPQGSQASAPFAKASRITAAVRQNGAWLNMTATSATDDANLFDALNGIPKTDIAKNLEAATAGGRRMWSLLGDAVALRRSAGKLTLNEYFYYRLWEPPGLTHQEKSEFVGKQAQQPMHIACNNIGWYATAADKLLFHTLMTGAGLARPELLAITGPDRRAPSGRVLKHEVAIAAFLRDRSNYPLFAKPIDGKYSIAVVSADSFDPTNEAVK